MDRKERGGRPPTIYDVARHAGVSHTTVSRVINGARSISLKTRAQVELAIDELNYTPRAAARTLVTGRTMLLGVILDTPSELDTRRALGELEREARKGGYAITVFSFSGDARADLAAGVRDQRNREVDAFCVIGARKSTIATLRSLAPGRPIVVVDGTRSPRLAGIETDHALASELVHRHLWDAGHRSFLFVAGPKDSPAATAQRKAWQAAIERMGGTSRDATGDWTASSGHRVGADTKALRGVTAVFAGNDLMALGVIGGLRSRGVRVPEDVSVVGFGDMPGAGHFFPPLTTVRQDFAGQAERIIGALTAAFDGSGPSETTSPVELILRGSVAPARSVVAAAGLRPRHSPADKPVPKKE